jgi:hypothetical protein
MEKPNAWLMLTCQAIVAASAATSTKRGGRIIIGTLAG